VADEEFGTQEQGAGEDVSKETGQPAVPQAPTGQPQKRVNLDDLPEGRALKSTYDQKIAAAERRAEQERLARLAAERHADEARMATMNEKEQLQYQLQKAQQYIQEQERMRQQELNELRRERDIDRLAAESGAPRDQLAKADSYDEAVQVALRYARKAAADAVDREMDEAIATSGRNSVDLGSGRPPPEVDAWEERRLAILKERDPHAYTMHILGMDPGD